MKYLLIKDIKTIINPKRLIITSIIFILIYCSFFIMFKDFMKERRILERVDIGVVDKEESVLTKTLISNFKENEAFSGLFKLSVDTYDNLIKKYNNNELSAIVELPDKFTDSLYYFENIPIKMILNPKDSLKNALLENIMSSYSTYIKAVDIGIYSLYKSLDETKYDRKQINEVFSMNLVMTALSRNTLFKYTKIDTYPSSSSKEYFLYSIIVLMMVFMTTASSKLFYKEYKSNTLDRYVLTGSPIFIFTLSKILALSLNIVLTAMPLMILVLIIGKVSILYFIMIILLTMITIIFFSTLFLCISILSDKINDFISILITLLLGLLGGQFIPLQILPYSIQKLSMITPNYWILKSYLLLNKSMITSEVLFIFAILSIMSVLLLTSTTHLIRRKYEV